jgi:hypothetical protein
VAIEQEFAETLVGITELAVALAGFTGVAVAFGSRDSGVWHPGDRFRLNFLIESSLTAGGFALLSLILLYGFPESLEVAWTVSSVCWMLFMPWSLYSSRRRIRENEEQHGDVDRMANRIVFAIFAFLVLLQVGNVFLWREFAPFFAALCFNLAGAAMQFVRLIRSTFHA